MAKVVEGASKLLRRAQLQLQSDYSFYDASHQLQPLDDIIQPPLFNSHTYANLSTTKSIAPLFKHKPTPSFLDHICHSKEGWGPLSPYRDLDFTPCFQDVALTVFPVALLILSASFSITYLTKRPVRTLSKASYTISVLKNALLVVIALCAALEVSALVTSYKHPLKVLPFWASIASLASYLVAFSLQHLNHTRARRSSTTLLLFWLYHIFASLIRLRTLATYPSPPIRDNMVAFVLQSTRLSLVVIVFALECVGIEVGEPRPDAKTKTNGSVNGNGNGYSSHLQGDGGSAFSNISDGSAAAADPTAADPLGDKECPENVANIFSRLTFHWLQPMMSMGSKKFLTEDDMWTLPPGEDAENLGNRFEHYYATCRTKDGGSRLWTAMFYSYGGPFMFAALLKAAQDTLAFAQPQLLRLLLQFVQSRQGDEPQSAFRGYVFSALLFIVATIQTSCLHAYFQRCFTTGMRVRAGLVSAIFKKSPSVCPTKIVVAERRVTLSI